MIPGINFSDRSTQVAIGLGLTGIAAGATLLAKRSSTPIETSPHDHCCDCSSISSLSEEAPVEIETEAVNVKEISKKTFIGSLGTLAKALVLLPLVIVASVFKGIFTGISSFFTSLFGKEANKVSSS